MTIKNMMFLFRAVTVKRDKNDFEDLFSSNIKLKPFVSFFSFYIAVLLLRALAKDYSWRRFLHLPSQSKLNGSLRRRFACIAAAETVRHGARGEKRAPRTRFRGPSVQTRARDAFNLYSRLAGAKFKLNF